MNRREFVISNVAVTLLAARFNVPALQTMQCIDVVRRMQLSNGRCIEYRILGDPGLPPIVYFCGSPTSFYELDMDRNSLCLDRCCIVGINRPGVGGSSDDHRMSLRTFADDMRELVAHLNSEFGWSCFRILGYSGGCPFALACASIEKLVTKIALVSAPSLSGTANHKNSLQKLTSQALNAPNKAKRQLRLLTELTNRKLVSNLALRSGVRKGVISQVDADMIRRHECIRNGISKGVNYATHCRPNGLIRELQLLGCAWEIDFDSITTPVEIWHGTLDKNQNCQNSVQLGALIPGSKITLLTEGHLTIWIRALPHIIDSLLASP